MHLFNIILSTKKGTPDPDLINSFIELKKSEFNNITLLINDGFQNTNIAFYVLIILNYSSNINDFFNFFLLALKRYFNFDINIEEKDLEQMTLKECIDDLCKIFNGKNDTNYFNLIIEDNHIVKKLQSYEKVLENFNNVEKKKSERKILN